MEKSKKVFAVITAAAMVTGTLGSTTIWAGENEKKPITMWFWGASDYQREAMDTYLINGFNEFQDEYELQVEYRASVDNDITVALSGGGGPDIIYGSGPSFVAGYAAEGLLENLDPYAEQYGWKDKMLEAHYDVCTVNGSLYSIPGGMTTTGIFYNKKTLEENGWEVPTTYEEVISIMEEAKEKGMYAGLSGAKDWRPTNETSVSMILTSVAGPETYYKVLTGEQKWNSPELAEAVDVLNEWYQNGYLAGDDYWNFDFNEAAQLLADGQSPFFFAGLNVFQFLKNVATEEQCNDIGYALLPDYHGGETNAALGTMCTFSVNSKSENKDGAAAVLDYMLSAEFTANMSSKWPGYWGMPVKALQEIDLDEYEGIYREYLRTCQEIAAAIDEGKFGYAATTCFSPTTFERCLDIDAVWFGDIDAEEYLDSLDKAYAEDMEAGTDLVIPKPGK